MAAAPGTRFGPYEVVKPLGVGGMGEVYEARDTRLDRPVAIKVLPTEMAADASARARFDREARAIAALNHPNICALHDIGDSGGHGYLVMERLEGETLHERLQRGPLGVEQTIEYGIALADALDAAHERGLIHRDLKPANIFITKRGVVKNLDYGLAKSVQEMNADITRAVSESLTTTGTTLGTVAYMSPEQLRGDPLDVRTDLFSFGLVLYEMATGTRAFPGSTMVVTAAGILNQQPRAPRSLREDLPPKLEQTILKALEKEVTDRYQTAAELRADLQEAKRGASSAIPPIPPTPPTRPIAADEPTRRLRDEPAPRQRPRRRTRWRAVLMVLFIISIMNGGRWFRSDRDRAEPPIRETAAPFPDDQPPPADGIDRVTPPPAPPAAPPAPGRTGQEAVPPNSIPDIPAIVGSAIATSVNEALDEAFGEAARGARGRNARVGAGGPALIKALRNAPPETYDLVYAAGDPEAMSMAMQIRGVLERAGWTTGSIAEISEPAAQLGIFAPRGTPGVTALTSWARRSGLQPDFRRVPNLTRPRIVVGKQP
jgi:serine/threonine protein kinase